VISPRRAIAGVLGGVALAYAIVLPALYFSQRSLVFPAPSGFADVPDGFVRVTLRTSDGLDLAAVWRAPQPGQPVAVFFHGNGDSWAGAALATQALAAAGYGVLAPEYRGYGTNPGEPSEEGLYRDGRAGLQWLGQQGIAPARTVLIGNSLGSGVATQLATERPVGALVLVSPFTSVPDVAAEKFWWLPVHWLARDRFDNLAKIGQVKAPMLVLQGLADSVIPPAQAERLAKAREGTNYVAVPGADHDLAYQPLAQQAQLRWLGVVVAVPR
jgi:uncharacterized protein